MTNNNITSAGMVISYLPAYGRGLETYSAVAVRLAKGLYWGGRGLTGS